MSDRAFLVKTSINIPAGEDLDLYYFADSCIDIRTKGSKNIVVHTDEVGDLIDALTLAKELWHINS